MASSKRKVIMSDEDDSQADDEEAIHASPPRTKRKGKASEKRSAYDKENLDKAQAAYARAQKALKKLKMAQQAAEKERNEAQALASGIESEDEDEDVFAMNVIRPLTPTNETHTPLQCVTVQQMSRGLVMPHATPTPTSSTPPLIQAPQATPAVVHVAPSPQSNTGMLPVKLIPGLKLSDSPCISDFADGKVQSLLLLTNRNYEVKARGSRVCGIFMEPVRNAVKTHFGFVTGKAPQRILKNMELCKSLIDDTKYYFHYKDPKTQTGYCDHPIIVDILSEVCFADKTSFGVLYRTLFKPISLPTLAFIFVLIFHAIKEWETGVRTKAAFTESTVKKHYDVYLADLRKWASINTTVTTKKREKMFQRAWNKGGIEEDIEPQPQLIGEAEERVRKELEAYAGDSDDNDSGSDDTSET
ncbi:hypothetical protein H0H92_004346 [Tricholoma furcatifolium]|nr:hypothetical protein H0H92_004346 [Tricholoma furcatifolium]